MVRARTAAGVAGPVVLAALLLGGSWTAGTAGSYSKPDLQFPADPYVHYEGDGGASWVKFTILVSDPDTVYFQDSNFYPFHYDFATNELAPFLGMTPAQFDAVSLYASGQQAILGAVLIPPTAAGQHVTPEYGIQLVRTDPYDPSSAAAILQTVEGHVIAGPSIQPYYMPTFEQLASAEQNAAFFEAQGFPVASPARWADGNGCYSHGWALGTLKYFETAEIDAAFVAGQLTPDDILLTDAVPAEIPFVAGVITLEPSTPNSHVALLAQTFDVPFAHLALDADAQKAQALVGRRVVLRVRDRYGTCETRVVDTEDELDPGQVDSLLALKVPALLNISPVETYGSYSAATDGLLLSDIRYFGGKAAGMGVLRQSIPASSPVSVALSFDLWNGFLDQTIPGTGKLRQYIAQQLAPFSYPPDIALLSSALDAIRDKIKDDGETSFSTALQIGVHSALQDPQYGFDANKKLRFRSSTNVEDSEQFTGAGLYDSFSGCLADELDGNSAGPSLCDPTQPEERGVFRAIRKVFASFYNLNAYLERLRHGIDEDDVGMALLVHHSFPDVAELANGVGSYTRGPGSSRAAYLVLQPGANSVTNPEPGQVPEEVDVYIFSDDSAWPTVVQESNLLLLGETVLDWPGEYETLTGLLRVAAEHYESVAGLSEFVLEFEFKKTAPTNALVVDQVRRVPQPDDVPSLTPFLLNEPTDYCLFQGEGGGSAFATHRLKSRWSLDTQSLWLTSQNLLAGFFDEASLEFVEGCGVFDQHGPLPGWPGFGHLYTTGQASESWSFDDLQNPRTYLLQATQIPELVSPADTPILLLTDFGWPADYSDLGCLSIEVEYASAVPDYDWSGPITTTTDYGMLCRCPPVEVTDIRVQESVTDGGISVDITYYWPKPVDPGAGYTAPLSRFVETTITGLTTQSIVLHGEHSQTYKPGHHNFTAEFVFEPALEPGLPQQTRDELAAQDVRVLYVNVDFGASTITAYGDAEWGYHCLACRGPDADADGVCRDEPTFDCDDANPDVWSTPGEVPQLWFTAPSQVAWSVPPAPGGNALVYDTLRSDSAPDFLDAVCVETDDGSNTWAPTLATPLPGRVHHVLVRAENDCPAGQGSLGSASAGGERTGIACLP